jgi:hypothetical protein
MKLFVDIRSKRMIWWIAIFVILSVLIYIPVHRSIKKSVPYKIATDFIIKLHDVIRLLGENVNCDLKIFSGYSLLYHRNGQEAKFDIYLSGKKGNGRAKVMLEGKDDKWTIVKAMLYTDNNGQTFNLL